MALKLKNPMKIKYDSKADIPQITLKEAPIAEIGEDTPIIILSADRSYHPS
jgi:uncharacterized protein YuzE